LKAFFFSLSEAFFYVVEVSMSVSDTKLGQESRALAEKVNKTIEYCGEDAGHCKAQLKDFIKDNKDRFSENDINLLLDLLDSLDLMEERLKLANEDLSDILFGSDE
jgi:mevalonate kinase